MPIASVKTKTVALAETAIESNSREQSLRQSQFNLDRKLHDLRSEFFRREQELGAQYLPEVEETMRDKAE